MRIQPAAPSVGPSLEQIRAVPPAARPREVQYVDEVIVLSAVARSALWYTVLLLIVSNAPVLAVFCSVYAHNERYDSLQWLLRNFFFFSEANAFLLASIELASIGWDEAP